MDEDYLIDKTKSDNAVQLVNRVTNNNYPNITALRKQVLIKINNIAYTEFHAFTEPEYRKAKEYNLPLLSDRVEDIQELVNGLIRLQFHYSIRTEVELPRLEKNAKDLIVKWSMIKS